MIVVIKSLCLPLRYDDWCQLICVGSSRFQIGHQTGKIWPQIRLPLLVAFPLMFCFLSLEFSLENSEFEFHMFIHCCQLVLYLLVQFCEPKMKAIGIFSWHLYRYFGVGHSLRTYLIKPWVTNILSNGCNFGFSQDSWEVPVCGLKLHCGIGLMSLQIIIAWV